MIKRRLAIAIFCLLATGCGQNGELFLPPDGSGETVTTPTVPAPTEEENDDDEETPAR